MFGNNDNPMFLPVWRGGQLLFFTNISDSGNKRLSYVAAAATQPGETKVKRTFLAPVNNDQLAHCQNIADSGPEVQKFFDAIGGGNLDQFSKIQSHDGLPFPSSGSRLIYTCLYLDFLRKYAVDEEIVQHYEAAPPETRANLDKSLGIYKILSSTLQSERASALLDTDIVYLASGVGPSLSQANFYRAAAIVKFEVGDYAAAETLMLQAVKSHNTEDKWRRLGDFANQGGNHENAIEYFLKAHALTPLPAPAALTLAKLLISADRKDDAQEFLEIATKKFGKPVAELIGKAG